MLLLLLLGRLGSACVTSSPPGRPRVSWPCGFLLPLIGDVFLALKKACRRLTLVLHVKGLLNY